MLSTTRLVSGFTRVNTLDSVPVIQIAPSPKATVNEPGGTWISATTLFVAGSIRARVPFLSVISQMLPAPSVNPPSAPPILTGMVAVTFPPFRPTQAQARSPQRGTQRLPNPVVRPEQGLLPTSTMASTLLVLGSRRATVFFGKLETQTDSSMAIQSGAPGTSNTASGFRAVIGTLTPGVFTPGRGGRLVVCENEEKRMGMTRRIRIMGRHHSKKLVSQV